MVLRCMVIGIDSSIPYGFFTLSVFMGLLSGCGTKATDPPGSTR